MACGGNRWARCCLVETEQGQGQAVHGNRKQWKRGCVFAHHSSVPPSRLSNGNRWKAKARAARRVVEKVHLKEGYLS